jgi:hypothetical protein
LARQVSEARAVAERRLHTTVSRAVRRADPRLGPVLVALLDVPKGLRFSELERLRRPPTRSTGTAMARALERVEEISAFGLGRVDLSRVPVTRLATLARYGLISKAQAIERTSEPKRTALVTVVVRGLEAAAIDDALDLFALLMATRLISPARRATERDRLAMLPVLEKASRTLARGSRVLFTELESLEQRKATLDPAEVWAAIEKVVSRAAVTSALDTVEELVPEDDGSAETALRTALGARYKTVRPFLRLLGESGALSAAPGGRRVLAGVRTLPALARRRVGSARCCRPISMRIWCRRHGVRRCTPTASWPPARWTATPMWCVSWSSCSRHSTAAMCSPRRRSAGQTHAPDGTVTVR